MGAVEETRRLSLDRVGGVVEDDHDARVVSEGAVSRGDQGQLRTGDCTIVVRCVWDVGVVDDEETELGVLILRGSRRSMPRV